MVAADRVDEQHRAAFLRPCPTVAPSGEGENRRHEIAPGLRQAIFVACRPSVIRPPLDDATGGERFKTPRQQIARYAEILDQLVETRDAEEQVPDDERRPPVTDQIEPARQRAMHPGKTGSLHESIILSCVIELNPIKFNH